MSRQGPPAASADPLQCCAPVTGDVLSTSDAEALARVFKALADPVRLRLLSMIAGAEDGEACVCDLTVGFQLSGPTISHHLKVLREAGLIEGDRRGTWIYYRAVPQALETAAAALAPGTVPV
ncbi:MAG TPA: metalloregulator ArsR/SmtB family transcription factor [Actinomycetes bacterium]|nr:metalloregulator ArsR/SmtB family transcription factor [Actinomycetes bacterium]